MKKTLKVTYVLALALVLSIFSCNNDDEETVIPEIIVEITVENLTASIDENPTNGQSVGTVQADGEGTLNFSITAQTPEGALSINSSTGEITVADAALFDFETNPEITATISVPGAVNTGAVTINLNDLDEISAQDLIVTIDENPVDGQALGSIQVDGGGTLSYSITSQTPAGALAINASTGELTVVDPNLFDFETNPIITATVSVDNSVNATTAIATINLTDVDEITVQDSTIIFDENPTDGDVVGSIQATANGSLTFTITFQSTAGALVIDQSTGELTVADAALFDFETNPSMYVVVSVDNAIETVSANASISINDLNEVGEFKYGGVIFWIDPATNDAGLVCTLNDQNPSTGTPYGCLSTTTGATGVAIGTGQANTIAIEAACTEMGTAADLAANLNANGYDDWFLPSQNEVKEFMDNSSQVNPTLMANGGTALIYSYWTSTEIDAATARQYNPSNDWFPSDYKSNLRFVRAIRAFTDF